MKSVEEQLANFVEDLEQSIQYQVKSNIFCKNVLLCGMGGSGFSGMFVSDYCFEDSKIPIKTNGNPYLPKWVSDDTLLVISSYSGNTVEVLQMFLDGIEKGCRIITMCSGGKLKKLADEYEVECILLPEDMQPRHAIGFMIGYTLAIMDKVGAVNDLEDVRGCIVGLKAYRDSLSDYKSDNEAKRIVKMIEGCVPMICIDPSLISIGFRWKTQINENSKRVAFKHVTKDSIVRIVDAWGDSHRREFALVSMLGYDDGFVDSNRMIIVKDGCIDNSIPFMGCFIHCDSMVEGMLKYLILGDYMSLYLAKKSEVEPTAVPSITDLKNRMKQMFCRMNISDLFK